MRIRIIAKDTGLGNQIQFIPHLVALKDAGHDVITDSEVYWILGLAGIEPKTRADWNVVLFGYGPKQFLKVKKTYSGNFAGFKYRVKGIHMRIGYAYALQFDPNRSEVEQYDDLITYCFQASRKGFALPSHYWDTKTRKENMVILGPSPKKEKQIPVNTWIKVVSGLKKLGCQVKMIDDPVLSQFHVDTPDVGELAREINEGSYYIGVDSGPMHLADILGLKTVVVFGPTSAAKNAPINKNKVIEICDGACYSWGRYNCPKNFACYEVGNLAELIIDGFKQLYED